MWNEILFGVVGAPSACKNKRNRNLNRKSHFFIVSDFPRRFSISLSSNFPSFFVSILVLFYFVSLFQIKLSASVHRSIVVLACCSTLIYLMNINIIVRVEFLLFFTIGNFTWSLIVHFKHYLRNTCSLPYLSIQHSTLWSLSLCRPYRSFIKLSVWGLGLSHPAHT